MRHRESVCVDQNVMYICMCVSIFDVNMKAEQRLTVDLNDERIAAGMDGWIDG